MSGEIIQLQNAQLTAGPAVASDGSSFPSGQNTIPLDMTPAQKPYVVSTGRQLANVNSPNAPVALPGIGGAVGPVTQAHTLYMRSAVPFTVNITYNGVTGAQSISLSGLLMLEVSPTNYITGVTVQGAGQLEWLAVGNA